MSLRRIAERAGVSRRALYYHFASKEALVGAYLAARDVSARGRLNVARDPLAVFDALHEWLATASFRGCALTNAAGEGEAVYLTAQPYTARHKRAIRDHFRGLVRGYRDPDTLADALMLLFDGAITARRTRDDRAAAKTARTAADVLLRHHAPHAAAVR